VDQVLAFSNLPFRQGSVFLNLLVVYVSGNVNQVSGNVNQVLAFSNLLVVYAPGNVEQVQPVEMTLDSGNVEHNYYYQPVFCPCHFL
jgi:hypothetical protein